MPRKPTKALVILSGGQDSTTCLYWACEHFNEVHAITFDYGQKHQREIESAQIVAAMAMVASHEIIGLPGMLGGRSPLTNPDEKLETYSDFKSMEATIGDRIEHTFVPMRNALFMTIAANRAICKDIRHIITGVCQADNANYPDCRQSYVWSAEQYINLALGIDKVDPENPIRVLTPLMNLSKAKTCLLGATLRGCYEALAFSHTAYDGQYPPVGMDHASVLRAEGYRQADLPDPLVVRAWKQGLMPLPSTDNYRFFNDTYFGTIPMCVAHLLERLAA